MTGIELYRTRLKFIAKHSRLIKRALKEQLQPVIDTLQYQNYDQLNVNLLINNEPVKNAYIEIYKNVGKTFGQNVNRFIKEKSLQVKSLEDDIWMQMMEDWCLRDCAKRIAEVTNYSVELVKKEVQKLVSSGIEEGLSIRQISDNIIKRLPKEYNKSTLWRSKRIAQTEVISASNMASIRAAEQTGLQMRKKWNARPYGYAMSAQNERHALLADLMEQNPGLNEPFIVDGEPLMYPGDPSGSARNTINCFCVQTFEVI